MNLTITNQGFNMSISKSLRYAQFHADEMSNLELGQRSGLSQSSITKIRNGTGGVSMDKVQSLANVFNMPVSEFIALGESK